MDSIVQVLYDAATRLKLALLDCKLLPDAVVRCTARLLLASRLRSAYRSFVDIRLSDLLQFVQSLREMAIAIDTEKAKSQHYEVPTAFFKLVLGKHFKYSQILHPFQSDV
ncbi:UNVERIFIED_CONTAM: hypothetical protein Sradi_2325400 [Sesamum radiatum]|uniref:Uncharacterized protein n=1 Tax=Sesamum radiatum TaxID=300843 RepID=A0AAW2T7Z1_SESRA